MVIIVKIIKLIIVLISAQISELNLLINAAYVLQLEKKKSETKPPKYAFV